MGNVPVNGCLAAQDVGQQEIIPIQPPDLVKSVPLHVDETEEMPVANFRQECSRSRLNSVQSQTAQTEVPQEDTPAAEGCEASPQASFHEGHQFLGKLGCGTFAQVYVVRRSGDPLASPLAVKVAIVKSQDGEPPRHSTDVNLPMSMRAIQREADIMRRASRLPGCLDFHGIYFEDSLAYIVSELCSFSFSELLRMLSPLTSKDVQTMFKQVFQSLAGIHSVGIVHRDIKPDNFLVQLSTSYSAGSRPSHSSRNSRSSSTSGEGQSSQEYCIKLCDFGLADIVTKARPMLRGTFGTAPFMSPEMVKKEEYNEGTDVWSAGVMLYCFLFGCFPYRPTDQTPTGMKEAIRLGEVPIAFESQLRDDGGKVPRATAAAVPLLQKLLNRTRTARITASQAAVHDWFKCRSKDDFNYTRAVIAAKRWGLFDMRNHISNGRSKPAVGIDVAVIDAQAAYHPGGGSRVVEPYLNPSTGPHRLSKESMSGAVSAVSTRASSASGHGSPKSSPKRAISAVLSGMRPPARQL